MSLFVRLATHVGNSFAPVLHALLVVGVACGNLGYVAASGAAQTASAATEPADTATSDGDLEELVGPIEDQSDSL